METKQTKPRKVLFLITKSNWGGAQRYVYDLATNLDRTRFEPVVAMGGDGALLTMLQNVGIRTIHIKSLGRDIAIKKEWLFAKELWRILRSERPDVFHVNSSKAGGVGTLLGQITGVPRVLFTAHGWAFNEDRPLWQRFVIKFLHWITVLMSDRTIAVSHAIVTQMNWPGALGKIKVINPGRTIGPMYDRTEARAKIIDFCPSLSTYVDDTWLVCIAELHPIKRHQVLLQALSTSIKTNPHTRLILIGEGRERENIERAVRRLELTNNVFLLGNIVEAARFLKAFDVCVLVSKSESYGYVLHEAGLANVPIIATNVGGIPDIIVPDIDGTLIAPDNVPRLIQALADLQTNLAATQTMATHLQQKLRVRTVAHMTRQTESLYSH